MRMLISACVHIHENGVTHRDLKPENNLLDTQTDDLKIIDFGLSKNDARDKEIKQLLVGTPHYMAPEIFITRGASDSYSPPCDMWSLGIIMYQLIAGFVPWNGETKEVEDQIM